MFYFQVENDISEITKRVNELAGIKESDTGLGPPAMWDLAADKQTLQSEQPLQVARCTKIINADTGETYFFCKTIPRYLFTNYIYLLTYMQVFGLSFVRR